MYICIYSLKDKAHSSPPESLPEIGTKTMKNEGFESLELWVK